MKRMLCLLLAVFLLLPGCGKRVETDYAAAIMVEDAIYLKSIEPVPGEVDESAILGYTKYYTNTFPKRNGETNFSRETGLPYARVEEGIAILMEGEWYICRKMK